MLKKNALVTATLADTEGVPVINLAHTISEKFKCTDFDKEDGAEIYTFVCEIDGAVTSMIVTEANDNKYLTLSMTAKDKEGFSAAGEFAKSLLDDDESSFNEADWIQSPSSTETTKIYNNSKNDVQITISHSDTQGLKIEALATMIATELKCGELTKEDEDAFSFTCKNGNTTTESLVTPGDEGKYVVITVTYKDEEGLKQGKEFIKNMLK